MEEPAPVGLSGVSACHEASVCGRYVLERMVRGFGATRVRDRGSVADPEASGRTAQARLQGRGGSWRGVRAEGPGAKARSPRRATAPCPSRSRTGRRGATDCRPGGARCRSVAGRASRRMPSRTVGRLGTGCTRCARVPEKQPDRGGGGGQETGRFRCGRSCGRARRRSRRDGATPENHGRGNTSRMPNEGGRPTHGRENARDSCCGRIRRRTRDPRPLDRASSRRIRERRGAGLARRSRGRIAALLGREATQSTDPARMHRRSNAGRGLSTGCRVSAARHRAGTRRQEAAHVRMTCNRARNPPASDACPPFLQTGGQVAFHGDFSPESGV